MYKKGDVVRVWSLQSFNYGGFINGTEGVVSQDQTGTSVIVSVPRKMEGDEIKVDPSYEVYEQQLELVHRPTSKVKRFHKLIESLKEL